MDRAAALLAHVRELYGQDVNYASEPEPLRGGFVTDVSAFALHGVPDEWSGELVLRVFPSDTDALAVRREVCAQEVVAAQGVPAPRVMTWVDAPGVLDAPFMVMERLPGRPQLVIEMPGLLLGAHRLFSLPRRHADAMRLVHRLDAQPLLDAFAAAGIDAQGAGPDHHLGVAEGLIDRWHLEGLRDGLAWLRANRPAVPVPPAICHGDLFGANILEQHGRVTGVIDWNLVTVGDPASDLGGQVAGNEMAAMPGPRVVQRAASVFGKAIARGLRRAYAELPDDRVRYYAASRAFTELVFKVSLLEESKRTGVERRMPTWDPPTCARYFRDHTGIALSLP